MTVLDDPPVVTEPSVARRSPVAGEPAAWRFAARLARRETRRRPGRTLLASLLIAVPVFAMTIGSVLARTENSDWSAQFDRRYGNADIAIDQWGLGVFSDSDAGAVELPTGTTIIEYLSTFTPIATGHPDVPFPYVRVSDIDLTDPATGSPIEVIDGDAPVAGEILLSENLAEQLDASIGDDVTFERPSGTWTVSGYGRVRDSYYNDAVVIPGLDLDRIVPDFDQRVTLYRLPADVSQADTQELAARLDGVTSSAGPYSGDPNLTRGMAWGWVAGVLALVAVGIIVAAAFATSARRQLVTIGQLTSNGATAKVVRRTLALQGTCTGLIGSIVGVVAGLVAVPIFAPLFERYFLLHDMSALRISLVDLLVITLTATVAGTVAASVPARSASRIPVMSALAGRRPIGTLPRWLVPTGLLLLAGGLGFVAIAALGINGSDSSSDDVWALMVIVGVLGVVFGMCCATPLVVDWIGRLGRRASLSWRLALRSLARSRTRSSAVVAAIAVAVGGSVAAGAIVETLYREQANSFIPALPADTVVVGSYRFQEEVPEGTDDVVDLDALPAAPLPDELREQIEAIVPGAAITPIQVATIDPEPFDTRFDSGVWPEANGPSIAHPALFETLGLSDGDIELLESTGSLQPISRWEANSGEEFAGRTTTFQYRGPDGLIEFDATRGTVPTRFGDSGSVLVTEAYARELGFDIVERGAIIEAPQALTTAQRNQLGELQSDLRGEDLDAFIESGDAPRATATEPVAGTENWSIAFDEPRYRPVAENLAAARLIILSAVVAISLLVVAIGLSLAAAEGRDERNVLAVVGATPESMRRQASANAVVLAGSGIALGIPTGFLPAWVLYSLLNSGNSISSEPLRFPWLIAGVLLVSVPLLVATMAWAGAGLSRRFRPPTPARRD